MIDSDIAIPAPQLVTLVYCVQGDQFLLLKRNKPPYKGHWVAPGGKVEPGESPLECALRELHEETGLQATDAELRAIITETSAHPDWQWLIFIYRVQEPEGELDSDQREGELRWFSYDQLDAINVPEGDRLFTPHVLTGNATVLEARFIYDQALNLAQIITNQALES